MSSDNLSYFRARAVEERERASAAANSCSPFGLRCEV